MMRSIYPEIESAAWAGSPTAHFKVVLRHSIRGETGDPNAELTDEGKALAISLGSSISMPVSSYVSSGVRRCVQTLEMIRQGTGSAIPVRIADETLKIPHVKDHVRCGHSFQTLTMPHMIQSLRRGEEVPGLHSLKDTAYAILGGIFAGENTGGTVDMFCTHDFQIAVLVAFLFAANEQVVLDNLLPWPRMLEGLVMWSEPDGYRIFWRNEQIFMKVTEIDQILESRKR